MPRPLIRLRNEACSNWILSHVLPFVRVAFAVANQMIEETFLPMRQGDRNCAGQSTLEHPHPLPQREVQVPANEQMNVVGHDEVIPDQPSGCLRTPLPGRDDDGRPQTEMEPLTE